MVFAMTLSVSSMVPVPAEELETDIPTAGATGLVGDYLANGDAKNISGMLPAYQTSPTDGENVNVNMNSKMSNVFSDIAIAKVSGGDEGYVNVRKKPNENSKVKGKIYNNCGAIVLEKTSNGWFKIKSGNCRGYCKASFFKTGDDAINFCLDEGYVFATVKENGVHLRSKSSSESSVVTNVFKGDCKSMKKYSKDGRWVKLRVSEGKNGWVSSDFVKVSVDFDQAKTIAEEKAEIAAQKAREAEEARQAAAEAAAAQENNNAGNGGGNNGGGNANVGNNGGGNTGGGTASNGGSRRRSNSSSYGYSKPKRRSYSSSAGSSGGGRGGSIVSYAKNFLGKK